MNEEKLNHSIRKFLKQVGVTSQREIEIAARAAAEAGTLPQGSLDVKVVLHCPELGVEHEVSGQLEAR